MTNEIESFGLDTDLFLSNCVTCIGGREENQDSCAIKQTNRGLLALVCDGMGGMSGGAQASSMAVKEIINYIDSLSVDDEVQDDNQTLLKRAISHANSVIYNESLTLNRGGGMGTTVTALLIDENKATVAYVGDSRVYQIRNGRKKFRTFDHSMVFELVKKNVLSEEQARLSNQSNIILKAVGIKPEISADTFNLSYDKGDSFFLCSDGIWGRLPEKELIKNLSRKKHPKITTETLAMNIHQGGKAEGGRHDNLTAAMIITKTNSKNRTKMEELVKKLFMITTALFLVSVICNFIPRKSHENKSISDIKVAVYQKNDMTPIDTTGTMTLNKALEKYKNNSDSAEYVIQIYAK